MTGEDWEDVGAWIDRSYIDSRVWVPHMDNTAIADSEGSSTTSLRRAKAHVLRVLGIDPADAYWVREHPGEPEESHRLHLRPRVTP